MDDSPTVVATNLDYRAHWDRVGPLLAHRRRCELRAMTWDERLRTIDAVLSLARPETRRDDISGLAEFYRRHRDRRS